LKLSNGSCLCVRLAARIRELFSAKGAGREASKCTIPPCTVSSGETEADDVVRCIPKRSRDNRKAEDIHIEYIRREAILVWIGLFWLFTESIFFGTEFTESSVE